MTPELSIRNKLPNCSSPETGHAAEQYLTNVTRANTIIFRFTSEEVDNLDFSRFLFLFGIDRPRLSGIEKLRGNLCVALPDSHSELREPFLCEKSRNFCRAFFKQFPYWAYFFSLQNLALWKMTLALVENSAVFQFDEPWKTKIILPTGELRLLISQQVVYATDVTRRVGLSDVNEFETAIRKYYSDLIASYCGPWS